MATVMSTNDLRRRVGVKAGKMQYSTNFALHLMMALRAAISQGSITGFTPVEKKRIFFIWRGSCLRREFFFTLVQHVRARVA